jgi:glutathione S-transferase
MKAMRSAPALAENPACLLAVASMRATMAALPFTTPKSAALKPLGAPKRKKRPCQAAFRQAAEDRSGAGELLLNVALERQRIGGKLVIVRLEQECVEAAAVIDRSHALLRVVDAELAGRKYLVGSEPTIADVAQSRRGRL